MAHKFSICTNCQKRAARVRGLCDACHSYWKMHGVSRPRFLYDRESRWCVACGGPKVGVRSLFLCQADYMRAWRRKRASHGA